MPDQFFAWILGVIVCAGAVDFVFAYRRACSRQILRRCTRMFWRESAAESPMSRPVEQTSP